MSEHNDDAGPGSDAQSASEPGGAPRGAPGAAARRQLRIRDLDYALAVDDRRNFARAAEACAVSQPTLSAQIRRLETALNVVLFDRTGRTVTPTAEGAALLREFRSFLDAFARIERLAEGRRSLFDRPLRFGAIPTIAPYLAARLMYALEELAQGQALTFVENQTEPLEQAVLDGALDFAVTASLPMIPGLSARSLGRERLVLVGAPPRFDPARGRRSVGPVLLMQEGHCFREAAYAALTQAGGAVRLDADLRGGAASFATLVALAAAGRGVTVLPAPFVAARPDMLALPTDPSFRDVGGLRAAVLPAHQTRTLHMVVRGAEADRLDVGDLAAAAQNQIAACNAAAERLLARAPAW